MKWQVTKDQIDSYRENGFVVIENFLDPVELKTWQRVTQTAVDERVSSFVAGKQTSETNTVLTNQDDPDAYYAQVFTQCVKLAETNVEMRQLMFDPHIGEMACHLEGIDAVRVWHDQALFKPPFGNPTGWHLDNPYWSFDSPHALSIWIALDDATLSNGCMYYVPATVPIFFHSG